MPPSEIIRIKPARLVCLLSLVVGCLICASIASFSLNEFGIRPNAKSLFYVDLENNIPTYFSSMQLLVAAGLLALIAIIKHRKMDSMGRHWTVLAIGFLLMSVDETSSMHEKLITPVRGLLHTSHLGIFNFAWVIPAIFTIASLGLYYLKFLRALPHHTRRDFLIAATLYLGGAVGMEMFGGWWSELHGFKNWIYYTEVHLEETMEMIGVLFFIRALLVYIQENHETLSLEIQQFSTRSQIANHDSK